MARTLKSAHRKNPAGNSAQREFMAQFFAQLSPQDLISLPPELRAVIGGNFWQFMQRRKPGHMLVRVYNPTLERDGWKGKCSVAEIIHDDMPFIVDSAMGAINKLGFPVQQIIHPVLRVRRDAAGRLLGVEPSHKGSPGVMAESCTHIQFDEIRDPVQLRQLEDNMRQAFRDVRLAFGDWKAMRELIDDVIEEISAHQSMSLPEGEVQETKHFLRWLQDNHYTFLGYRRLELRTRRRRLELAVTPRSGRGVLHDPDVFVFNNLSDLESQPPEVQNFMQERRLLMVTKTNRAATVHRPVPMDAIFVKRFDKKGNVAGEHLFIGLFTSFAYSRSPREIPLLRQKVSRVLAKAQLDPISHDGKSLIHILDNYPRDEMYQISERELYDHAIGILGLQERQQVALFVRLDPFERFATCLIYVPRDYYTSALRVKFQRVLQAGFGGTAENFNVRIDDSPLARVFMTVTTTPGAVPAVDLQALEEELRDIARPWSDRLRDQLYDVFGDGAGRILVERYHAAFPQTYREATSVELALQDIGIVETMEAETIGVNLLHHGGDSPHIVNLRIFHRGTPLALSQVLPMIENMGLFVEIHEGPYVIEPHGVSESVWLHDFIGRVHHAIPSQLRSVKTLFENAFRKIWQGQIPNDGFNQLVLRAELPWREVNVLRVLAKYARQLRSPHSEQAIIAALAKHHRLAQLIVALFMARHDPAAQRQYSARSKAIEAEAVRLLADVPNLDEDRIIRRLFNLVRASVRTNYFQFDAAGDPKSYLAIKFDCGAIDNLPLPKPLYEIFVVSARMEGIHLRGGKVARGGIRWSERPEDFRTEILGLMKAQMVKNSVIVPVGAKGGFVVKNPDPQNAQKEGVECYRTLMRGLLDLTDNRVKGRIVPPGNIVRHDGDDPYLVVAADKGTAKFSDIANGISADYDFWLGDAFASGGSAGYDHKHMGITALGVWEAVKRHFRELGKNIQREDFTCIGVGDMSGDVFGNGMLRSKHIRLLGAFDHRHIFCDPNPDAAKSFAERRRLFAKQSCTWADYDPKLISRGGGIFSRNLKTIKITPEMQAAYGLTADQLSPSELIQAMLRASADLLYFGGVGTFVKGADERHEEAGDHVNDSLRIDAAELRVKVVAEGANLGMTQRARIEYALKGGCINTDAIDNSAGVDTSDHEVNIKIALARASQNGTLRPAARKKLLAAMTGDVARLVLRDNYLQTQALSLVGTEASELLIVHVRVMRLLERSGLLNRRIEVLPDEDELADRQRAGRGLTRPELAVLLAYAKIWLFQQLLASGLPDDQFLESELVQYFPTLMRTKFVADIRRHQLRREIIATSVANSLINHAGIHFVMRITERTGRSAADITQAYWLTREAFGLVGIWQEIEALDNKVSAQTQIAMQLIANQAVKRLAPWFLREHPSGIRLDRLIPYYRRGALGLASWLARNGDDRLSNHHRQNWTTLKAAGVPAHLAYRIATLPLLAAAPDLQSLARTSRTTIAQVADIYFRLDQQFSFAWLRERAQQLPTPSSWQRDAGAALIEEMLIAQRKLTASVLREKGRNGARYQRWLQQLGTRRLAAEQTVQELRAANNPDLAMLTLATRQLAALGE
ncbi:MAG: NAD-glutamate dehydrogenase [Alphaproteobacteria bacterium]